MSVWQTVERLALEHDNHESDLYVKATPKAEAALKDVPHSSFISQIDNALWYEFPFMYQPWWDRRARA